MSTAVFHHSNVLPWTVSVDERRRLHRIIVTTLTAVLLCSLLIPMIRLPDDFSRADHEVPARFARLIVDERPPPPPPAQPVEREQPAPEPEPEPVEEPRAEHEPAAKKPDPVPVAKPPQASARERASRTGLLALSQELAAMRDESVARDLEQQPLHRRTNAGPEPRSERAVITARAGATSAGIDTAKLSRDVGDTALTGRETTRVEAPAESAATSAGSGRPSRDTTPARSNEEIQIVFDRNKGSLNALYNRALRSNPALAGKVVLRLTIKPDGSVVDCELVSSELGDPSLEHRLLARVELFDFGAKEVATTTVTYPIDFFPG